MSQAKDLTKEAPRSPRTRLGGYVILDRMIDKGRATIAGTNGEYHFACPLDQMILEFKQIPADDVKNLLASGAPDEQILAWVNENGTSKTAAEIETWSSGLEGFSLNTVPEKQAYFVGECTRLGLDPEKATLFDVLDADDIATFKK